MDFATICRELWGCGLCVCVFVWPRWSKGGAKSTPKSEKVIHEYYSAISGSAGLQGAPENQQHMNKQKTQITKCLKNLFWEIWGDVLN